MIAARVHQFGGLDAIVIEDIAIPQPGDGEVLVRVHAAGVGPWDAWIRGGTSVVDQPLPLTLGADFSGEIVALGAGTGRTTALNAGTGALNAGAGTGALNAGAGTGALNAGTGALNAGAGTGALNAGAGTSALNAAAGTGALNAGAGTGALNAGAGTGALNAGAGALNAGAGTGALNAGAGAVVGTGTSTAGAGAVVGTGTSAASAGAGFAVGDLVYGATNPRFTGAYAEYAVVRASMIAARPALGHIAAASLPIVAVTALQMLERAQVRRGHRVLVLGGGGNVGAFAVQLARFDGAHVIAADVTAGLPYAHQVGADELVDTTLHALDQLDPVDAVIDTVGGPLAIRALDRLAPGGVLISAVACPPVTRTDVTAAFLLVDVTTAALATLAARLDAGALVPRVGSIVPLADARTAHAMLAGAPHLPGKIVLATD